MEELEILDGRTSYCPDCAAERLFIRVAGPEFCCSTCDAALLFVDASDSAGDLQRHPGTAA